jgi:hypothetical protein
MKGCTGTLVAIDEKAFAAEIEVVVDKNNKDKTTVVKLEYEDFSKLGT